MQTGLLKFGEVLAASPAAGLASELKIKAGARAVGELLRRIRDRKRAERMAAFEGTIREGLSYSKAMARRRSKRQATIE